MSDVFIASAVRTPIGKFGGALKNHSPADLAAVAMSTDGGQAANRSKDHVPQGEDGNRASAAAAAGALVLIDVDQCRRRVGLPRVDACRITPGATTRSTALLEIVGAKNKAFAKILFVPNQKARKLVLSARQITFPLPWPLTIILAVFLINSLFSLLI